MATQRNVEFASKTALAVDLRLVRRDLRLAAITLTAVLDRPGVHCPADTKVVESILDGIWSVRLDIAKALRASTN